MSKTDKFIKFVESVAAPVKIQPWQVVILKKFYRKRSKKYA